jgi:hypothetical protein
LIDLLRHRLAIMAIPATLDNTCAEHTRAMAYVLTDYAGLARC